jgi:hypothetical protein
VEVGRGGGSRRGRRGGARGRTSSEPEFGSVRDGIAGRSSGGRWHIRRSVAGTHGGIVADDFKGAVAGEVEETFAKAVGHLRRVAWRDWWWRRRWREHDGARRRREAAQRDSGGSDVQMFEDFGQDDDVVGREEAPGGGVGGVLRRSKWMCWPWSWQVKR